MHPSWNDYPHLVAELDPDGNKGLTHYGEPIHVLELQVGTTKKIDWICSDCSHRWKAKGKDRSSPKRATGCPCCGHGVLHSDGINSMAATHPKLALEYQGDATKIVCGVRRKIPWKCSTCEHEWEATGDSRKKGIGCPACDNKVVHIDGRNSMATTHPEWALEYQGDATKVIAGTNKKLDWKCRTCEHEWTSTGNNRQGCPACSNRSLHIDGRNSLAFLYPDLASEYQGDATKVLAGTDKKLLWKCRTCEHEWKAKGWERTSKKKNGCPACSNHAIHIDGRNSMASTHPDLAIEYQGDATKVVAGTNKKLPWKCLVISETPCGYEWTTGGNSRVQSGRKGTGCPACAITGYRPDKPSYYYVNSISKNGKFVCFKGGISIDWKQRLKQLKALWPNEYTIKNCEAILFETGKDAHTFEQKMRKVAKEEGWKAPHLGYQGGTELFLENPLDHARRQGLI